MATISFVCYVRIFFRQLNKKKHFSKIFVESSNLLMMTDDGMEYCVIISINGFISEDKNKTHLSSLKKNTPVFILF